MATAKHIYSDLPKIVYFIGLDDSGEYGNANCPHCGADGRYTYYFVCDDGTTRGAMKGCLSKFKMHGFAKIHATLLEKQKDYSRKNWKLPSWDLRMLEVIEQFGRGEISEHDAQVSISNAKQAASNYRKSRYGRR